MLHRESHSCAPGRGIRPILIFAFLGCVIYGAFGPPTCSAHPLGNYSINQYFMLDLRGEDVEIYYLLDLAELPSLPELEYVDPDGDSDVTEAEAEAYLDRSVPPLMEKIKFIYKGSPVALKIDDRKFAVMPGVGGMAVINILIRCSPEEFAWPGPEETADFEIRTDNYSYDRGVRECKILLDGRFTDQTESIGEEEMQYQSLILIDDKQNPVYHSYDGRFQIRLAPGTGKTLGPTEKQVSLGWTSTSRLAQKSPPDGSVIDQDQLLAGAIAEDSPPPLAEPTPPPSPQETPAPEPLPQEPKESPRESFSEEDAPVPSEAPGSGLFERMSDRVTDGLRADELTPLLVITGLLFTFLLGMGHAFSPGHGKTVVAAYLIGERGTVSNAVVLGFVVTVTHTWSVLLLGVVTLYFSDYISQEQLTFWLGIVSGGIVVSIGVILFLQRYGQFVLARQKDGAKAHGHHHDDSHNHHHHTEGHNHGHSHIVETDDGRPPSYWRILWLGVSGGIVPCPSALIVLIVAISLDRLAYGLWLIVSFSVGLAIVLVAIGIAVVKGAGLARKKTGETALWVCFLPVISSVLVTVLGLWLIVYTLLNHNVIIVR